MTKNKWLLVSVLSAVSGVGVAAAQPGGPDHFAKLDSDGDGTVTAAEFEASFLARWTESDADRDGKVSADEMKAQFAQHKLERFSKRDANGNGVLERTEVERMPEAIFTKLDTDGSGALSQAELESGRPEHGGKGPRGEARGLPGDSDHDGAVTKAEATAGVQKMVKQIDANGDGKLTKEEFGRGHGHGHKGPRPDEG